MSSSFLKSKMAGYKKNIPRRAIKSDGHFVTTRLTEDRYRDRFVFVFSVFRPTTLVLYAISFQVSATSTRIPDSRVYK
jgi:hypothetical protein